MLQNARLWQRCGGGAPETAEGLRAALGVLSGDEAAVAAAAHVSAGRHAFMCRCCRLEGLLVSASCVLVLQAPRPGQRQLPALW